MAFFFGPIAGASVSIVSLRRMRHPEKAKRVFLWTLLAATLLAVVLLVTPDGLGRLIGLASEFIFYFIFPRIQDHEFEEWQGAHPDVPPSNGWKALGWGVLGLFLFLAIAIVLTLLIPTTA